MSPRGPRTPNIPIGAAAAIPPGPEGGGLKRAITPGLLLFFIVGDILGGGIYARVGEVAGETGGAIWVAFALALVMAAFTAGSYAELVGNTRARAAPGCTSIARSAIRSSASSSPSPSWPRASRRRARWRGRSAATT